MSRFSHRSPRSSSRRFLTVLALFLPWLALTLLAGRPPEQGEALADLVTGGVGRQFVLAAAFLIGAVAILRWPELGIARPPGLRALFGIFWLPLLYLAVILGLATLAGLPAQGAIGYIAINTALVGLSEELMFRGFLHAGLRSVMSLWPALLLGTGIFGAVHVLNVFQTGDLVAAAIQALAAAVSGLLYLAFRLRTGSVLPGILYHWFWDFSLFLLFLAAGGSTGATTGLPLVTRLLPVGFVLPLGLYALYLMRGARGAAGGPDRLPQR